MSQGGAGCLKPEKGQGRVHPGPPGGTLPADSSVGSGCWDRAPQTGSKTRRFLSSGGWKPRPGANTAGPRLADGLLLAVSSHGWGQGGRRGEASSLGPPYKSIKCHHGDPSLRNSTKPNYLPETPISKHRHSGDWGFAMGIWGRRHTVHGTP